MTRATVLLLFMLLSMTQEGSLEIFGKNWVAMNPIKHSLQCEKNDC